jgi:hypothetical protein
MAGKKRRANKTRTAGFAASAARRPANKKRQQQTHVNHVAEQRIKTAATKELFNQVCDKYELDSKGKYALKRLIGTINASRLTMLLNKTIKTEHWFIKRVASITSEDKPVTNAAKLIRSTKLASFIN